jgi:hypothetical protein
MQYLDAFPEFAARVGIKLLICLGLFRLVAVGQPRAWGDAPVILRPAGAF